MPQSISLPRPTIEDISHIAAESVEQLYLQAAMQGRPGKKLTTESDTIVIVKTLPENWSPQPKKHAERPTDRSDDRKQEQFYKMLGEAENRMASGVAPLAVMEYINQKLEEIGVRAVAIMGRDRAIELLFQEILRSGFMSYPGILDDIYIDGTDGVYQLAVVISPDHL